MPGSAALTPASGAGPEARRVPRAPRPGDAAPAATRHDASRTSLQSTQPHKDGGEAAKAVPCPRRSVDVGPFEATQGKRVRTRLVHPPAAGTSPQSQGEDGRRAGGLSQRPGRLDVKGHDPTKILGCLGAAARLQSARPWSRWPAWRRAQRGTRTAQLVRSGGRKMWETQVFSSPSRLSQTRMQRKVKSTCSHVQDHFSWTFAE